MSWSWSPVVGHILADAPTLFAHQGGWDEMLMVVVPVAAFAALLYGANRRASQLNSDTPSPTSDDDATAYRDTSRASGIDVVIREAAMDPTLSCIVRQGAIGAWSGKKAGRYNDIIIDPLRAHLPKIVASWGDGGDQAPSSTARCGARPCRHGAPLRSRAA